MLVACVFVVDDEPAIAFTLTTILKLNGYDARCFTNPIEALEAITANRPDLLISDVMMPEMSGVDLAVRFKEQCPSCKVLLFSGQAQTVDLLRVARAQGRDFQLLTKPVHPTDLLARIKGA
jgi:DNA-binding response OmpR family regulator